MEKKTGSVAQYLAGLPPPRRAVLKKLRALLKRRVPRGYRESMAYLAIYRKSREGTASMRKARGSRKA